MLRNRRVLLLMVLPVVLPIAAGCSLPSAGVVPVTPAGAEVHSQGVPGSPATDPAAGVPPPGPFTGPTHEADLVVVVRGTISRQLRRGVARTDGVVATLPLAMASAPVAGRMVTLGAVDPSSYRPFTPEVTARAEAVWRRVAEGDLAVSPELADELDHPLGEGLMLGNDQGALTLRVGAQASMPPKIDAVVNEVRGRQLGMEAANAILVSTGDTDPTAVAERLRERLGARATVTPLDQRLPSRGRQTAFLTGGSVAEAVGSFTYRYFEDGTVEPDPDWVSANLRTEAVPILGNVTCHRVMLPQLRAALQEVADSGLADRIEPGDFGGCYAPRFIASNPSNGLSLHTWGIAVDLNVQGNQRGTVGEIDRGIVAIFKRWGFAWGGDWSYTDPMHFELAALVHPR